MIEDEPGNRYAKVSEFQRKLDPKNTRKIFQSANGLAALANSSLATTLGPGGEISLVTLTDLLAERLGNNNRKPSVRFRTIEAIYKQTVEEVYRKGKKTHCLAP